jgi:hypothetical protein
MPGEERMHLYKDRFFARCAGSAAMASAYDLLYGLFHYSAPHRKVAIAGTEKNTSERLDLGARPARCGIL